MTPMRDGREAWAPSGGSVRFAGRVAARHARRSLLHSVAGRVMVRAARGVRVVTVRDGRAVRLELRVRVDVGGAGNDVRHAGAVWGSPPSSTYARRRARAPSIERTTEQPGASRDRIEPVTAGRRGAPSTAAPYASTFPPVPRVVTRGMPNDAAAATGIDDSALRYRDRAPAPSRTPATAPSASVASFTPPELDRLTNHVVSVIDRRLAAYRERHGRG